MKKIFLILGFIFVTIYAQAQNTTDSTSSKKNELLLAVKSPTLGKYFHNDNLGLMYRRNYNKVSLRFKIDGSLGGRFGNGSAARHQEYYIKTSIGIEKNVRLTSFCQFYWGGDIFYANGLHTKKDSISTASSNIHSMGFSPIVGLKFSLGKRFSLGVENSGSFSFNTHSLNRSFVDQSTLNSHGYKQSFNFRPSNGIRLYLGIRF